MRTRTPILFAALLLHVGCGETIPDRSSILLQNLGANEQLWRDGGARNYAMTVARSCSSCSGLVSAPVRVTVANGAVTTQVNTSTSQPIPSSSTAQYPNVEGLFSAIRQAINENVKSMQAIYDEELGFPVRIRIDYDLTNATDDITIDVTQFVRS
jgi:hypothetical protein